MKTDRQTDTRDNVWLNSSENETDRHARQSCAENQDTHFMFSNSPPKKIVHFMR